MASTYARFSEFLERPARRTPRAGNARLGAYGWTTDMYEQVCDAMQAKGRLPHHGTRIGRVVAGLEAYLRHGAPRAPTIPRGHGGLNARDLVLWRGVLETQAPKIPSPGQVLRSKNGCYTAFSRDRKVAEQFAGRGGVLFMLAVRDVARSTPWAWFGPRTRERNMVESQMPHESEVLLPPGYFRVMGGTTPAQGPRIVRVAYVPEPRYLLKAQVPVINATGAPVVPMIGGEGLRFPKSKLRNRVAQRRDAIEGRWTGAPRVTHARKRAPKQAQKRAPRG